MPPIQGDNGACGTANSNAATNASGGGTVGGAQDDDDEEEGEINFDFNDDEEEAAALRDRRRLKKESVEKATAAGHSESKPAQAKIETAVSELPKPTFTEALEKQSETVMNESVEREGDESF
jgi:hypothetical protein